MITISGEGLGILITCKLQPIYGWLSFASWYSIKRNLPDAKLALLCERSDSHRDLFQWAYRAGVKLHWVDSLVSDAAHYFLEVEKTIVISSYIMAVRECDFLLGPIPAKSEQAATLVDCESGCGKFVASKWIDKVQIPFINTKIFECEDMTSNEIKVLDLWNSCNWLYTAMQ